MTTKPMWSNHILFEQEKSMENILIKDKCGHNQSSKAFW